MNSKKASESAQSSSKQTVRNGLKTASSSNLASQSKSQLVRERSKVRASSAKYYDIASTILGGSTDVEELFLNSAKNGNCRRLEQLLQQSGEIGLNIDCVDKRTGNTALIWASKRGHSKVVELLLRHGADATLCNYETQTALETAFLPVKTIILDWIDSQEVLNERLLLQAAWQGNLSVVRKVLQNKNRININCHNAEGLTPLILVCRDMQLFERLSSQLNRLYNPIQVAEELMKGKADIEVTDSNGRSCLHYASQSHASSAEGLTVALVAGGLDMELCDKHLLTPLHVAAQAGNTGSLVALVDRGSDVNAKGFAGLTPLHMTAFNDHHTTALTLLKYGADVTVTDDHGLTPADVAKTRKMKHTLKDAWLAAKKGSSPSTDEAVNVNTKSGVDENVLSNQKAQTQSQNAKSKALCNIDRCKQVERKILQEFEALKAPLPILQRESTRLLGTTRTKILPQIGRSKSPENYSRISQGDTDARLSVSRRSDGLLRSLEDSTNKPHSEESSILDIGIGKRVNRSKPPDLILPKDLQSTRADILKDAYLREKGSSHQREDVGSPSEIMRSHSILKDEFILEESRPKEIFSSSDPASSTSSGSLSSSSPRDILFPQPSPTRTLRHDLTLSTLQEQHISTSFLVSESLANTDGKPLIMKPHKRLRRRSENSLSSSLESDIDDLRADKAVTRSNSLKKSVDQPGGTNQEPITLSSPLAVFKSQSMESISPRVQSETSLHRLASVTISGKSNSDGNLDSVHKDHLQAVTSSTCQSTSYKKVDQSVAIQNPAKCIKASKKLIIEPFIGKTRALTKTRVDSSKRVSSDASIKKIDNSDEKLEQKSKSDVQHKSITRDVKEPAGSVKPQAKQTSEAKKNLVAILTKELSITKTSPVANSFNIHSLSAALNPQVSRSANLNTSVCEPETKQSCKKEKEFNSEEHNTLEDVSKQKSNTKVLLQKLNITEKYNRRETKQHLARETAGEECKKTSDNFVQLNIQKNLQNEKNFTTVAKSSSTHSCDSIEPIALVAKSGNKGLNLTLATPSEQNSPSVSPKYTVSKSLSCLQESTPSLRTKCGPNSQDLATFPPEPTYGNNISEPNLLPLKNYLLAFKPNVQLQFKSTESLLTARLHGNEKMAMSAAEKETYAVISTPVIVNPFENFSQPHARDFENSTKDVTVKAKKPVCSKISNKNVKKAVASSKKRQTPSILKQNSAGKKPTAKTKDVKPEKELRPTSGRKSGKGQRGKKMGKSIANEKSSECTKPNTTGVPGIGWHLSASCAGTSEVEVSSDLHLYSSDSDFSLDLDEKENSPYEGNHIKEMLNREPIHAFIDPALNSSRSIEEEQQLKPSLYIKPSDSDGEDVPPAKQNNIVDVPRSSEQGNKTSKHNCIGKSKASLSTDLPSTDSNASNDVEGEMFNTLSPIPETYLSKPTNITDVEINCQEFSTNNYQSTSDSKSSDETHLINKISQYPVGSEHQERSRTINENREGKTDVKYEYRPSGKVARSQSLKEYHSTGKGVSDSTFSETHNQQNSADNNNCDRNEDIDEIIEEILSTTTSSMTSTMRNCKTHDAVFHKSGTHSLSESDKILLLKMSQSVFASPFHATSSLTSKISSADTVYNSSETPLSTISSPDAGDYEQTSVHSQSPTPPPLSDRQQGHNHAAPSVSSKPPPLLKSSLKEAGTSRSVILGRSSSSRERGRHYKDSKIGAKITNDGAKQLVKIFSSFKNMGLQASTNTLASASFRSKGRFQEIKDDGEIRISLQLKDKPGQQSVDVCQVSTVGSQKSSVSEIKYDECDTIQWKKGNVLGRGAFGTVWCGLTSEGQLIAVKQIELTTMDKSKAEHEYEKIQEEVDLLKTLEHVNIVSYLGTSLEDTVVSIFMQFIPGGSIASILARFGALEESVFRHYTKQILEGVNYLHENDVIHRDIKGANVMLMPNGVIKLIDFGCAKRLCFNMSMSQTELLKSMNGTPFWMAPEVVNESGHGKKSDIWSIGCTVFEMATRKPPWADMNPMAAIFAIGSSSRPVPTLGSRFSHDARDFVSQCMTRDQDARPGALALQEHPFIITKQTSRRLSKNGD